MQGCPEFNLMDRDVLGVSKFRHFDSYFLTLVRQFSASPHASQCPTHLLCMHWRKSSSLLKEEQSARECRPMLIAVIAPFPTHLSRCPDVASDGRSLPLSSRPPPHYTCCSHHCCGLFAPTIDPHLLPTFASLLSQSSPSPLLDTARNDSSSTSLHPTDGLRRSTTTYIVPPTHTTAFALLLP